MDDKRKEPATPWKVSYSDGSGNRFSFERGETGAAIFTYDPVQPLQSSSGVYSGGSPRTGKFEPVVALWTWVRRLQAATDEHLDHRPKLSGQLFVGDDSVILRNGALKKEFEAFLEPFRGK